MRGWAGIRLVGHAASGQTGWRRLSRRAARRLAVFCCRLSRRASLGITGLGEFGLLYGILVLATAISSGFVGDSLTVLDRQSHQLKAALQNWLVLVAVVGAILCAVGVWATGFVEKQAAVAFGMATFVFVLEDAVRRLQMARSAVLANRRGGRDELACARRGAPASSVHHFGGVVCRAGCRSGMCNRGGCLPTAGRGEVAGPDRRSLRSTALYSTTVRSGRFSRPFVRTLLALTRIVVIALVGVAAAGQLEAGRIYMAPALLVVFGLNSFLFASYALDAKSALPAALRRADRGVRLLLAITVAFGVVAVLCVPVLGPLIAGGQYDIPVTTVVGWVVYAISVAAVTPYGALAAVRGLQAAVLAVRVGDSLVSLALAAAVAYVAGSAECVPFRSGGRILCRRTVDPPLRAPEAA